MPSCLLPIVLSAACASGTGAHPAAPGPAQADPWLAEDKLRHFALSFAATEMSFGAARLVVGRDTALPAAATTALALGLAKELRDRRAGGRFSFRDLAWNIAGVTAGVALVHNIP